MKIYDSKYAYEMTRIACLMEISLRLYHVPRVAHKTRIRAVTTCLHLSPTVLFLSFLHKIVLDLLHPTLHFTLDFFRYINKSHSG